MNRDTVEFLQVAAEKGSWDHCSIELSVDPRHPEAGSEISIAWRIEHLRYMHGPKEGGMLKISSPHRNENLVVQRAGNLKLHIGIDIVKIELYAGGERKRITIKPSLLVPEIALRPPAQVVLNEEATAAWTVRNAFRCRLQVRNGDEMLCSEEVPANGQMKFIARKLQAVTIQMQAISRHADLSEKARSSIITSINVVAPPVKIHIDGPEAKTGLLGDDVSFNWRITGAGSAFLKGIDRNEFHPVPLIGGIIIEVVMDPETFELVAIGLDGVEHVQKLNVVPRLADLTSMPKEYSRLHNTNWEV